MAVAEEQAQERASSNSTTFALRLMSMSAAVALAATGMLDSNQATAQQLIIGGGANKKASAILKDDGKCTASPELAAAWIEQNPLLQKLRIAFQQAVDHWNDLPQDRFYYDATSGKSITNREDAQRDVKAHFDNMVDLAVKYSSKQRKSCETCYRFGAWADIVSVARIESENPLQTAPELLVKRVVTKDKFDEPIISAVDNVNVKNLTVDQVENANVTKWVDRYYKVFNLKRPTAAASQAIDGQTCSEGLFPKWEQGKLPSANGCNSDWYTQALVFYAAQIVDALKSSNPSPGKPTLMMDLLKQSNSGFANPSCPKALFPMNWVLFQYDR